MLDNGSRLIFTTESGKQYRAESAATLPYVPQDQNLVVPPAEAGSFVQLRHWDELGGGDDETPIPEMLTPAHGLELRDLDGKQYEYAELSKKWQFRMKEWWDYNSQYRLPEGEVTGTYTRPGNDRTFYSATPGSLTALWIKITEAHIAFTEGGSREAGSRDDVLGVNLGARKAIEWLCNPCCGNVLRRLRTDGAWYDIEALNLLQDPPPLSYIVARPWLRFWCTQYSHKQGGTRFPHIKNVNAVWGLPPQGVASLLLSKGGVIRVKKSSCKVLTNGAPWSPYAPNVA